VARLTPGPREQDGADDVRERLALLGLFGVSLGVGLAAAELTLRLALPSPRGYYVYPPHLERVFEPDETLMPGVRGPSRFLVNAEGLRGDELADDDDLRILAVGGSTTQCLYLDHREAWPRRLQDLLGAALPGRHVWVGNAGKAGRRLPEHIVQIEHLLPQIPQVDAVVLLVGANDVNQRLGADRDFRAFDPGDPRAEARLLPRAFDLFPKHYAWLPPSRTALWSLRDRVEQTLRVRRAWRQRQDNQGENYQRWREQRAEAPRLRDALPDLTRALATYRADLESFAAEADRHGVRVLYVTQPAIYRPDLPEELETLLWMGWVGTRQSDPDQEYYSARAMAEAYDLYNGALRDFCRETGADCLDLAEQMPKDTSSFYDDLHFNESGSERVARALFGHLRDAPWLGPAAGGAPPREPRGVARAASPRREPGSPSLASGEDGRAS